MKIGCLARLPRILVLANGQEGEDAACATQ